MLRATEERSGSRSGSSGPAVWANQVPAFGGPSSLGPDLGRLWMLCVHGGGWKGMSPTGGWVTVCAGSTLATRALVRVCGGSSDGRGRHQSYPASISCTWLGFCQGDWSSHRYHVDIQSRATGKPRRPRRFRRLCLLVSSSLLSCFGLDQERRVAAGPHGPRHLSRSSSVALAWSGDRFGLTGSSLPICADSRVLLHHTPLTDQI